MLTGRLSRVIIRLGDRVGMRWRILSRAKGLEKLQGGRWERDVR